MGLYKERKDKDEEIKEISIEKKRRKEKKRKKGTSRARGG